MEAGPEINTEKNTYVLMSHDQNAGQNHNTKLVNRGFKNVINFRHLGTTATNQNLIQEKIKSRLKLGNACYRSVQNLLSFHLLSKKIQIKTCKIVILPVVLYGSETWSLTLGEEHRLSIFENRVFKRILGQEREEIVGGWRKLHEEIFTTCTLCQI
jgi:hypothetical protein